jgi:carboxylate-amine ligase
VALVNGLGTGAADDNLVFMWMPEMIERYLGETPIFRQAPSYNLQDPESRRFVMENLDELVVKVRQGYGGTGVFVMPDLDSDRMAQVARNILEAPDVFIAQETLDFSKHMVFNDANRMLEPRHIDLRVFAIQDGNGNVTVFPGGLTRVARPGGRITNNSSGGICKPTWVVR